MPPTAPSRSYELTEQWDRGPAQEGLEEWVPRVGWVGQAELPSPTGYLHAVYSLHQQPIFGAVSPAGTTPASRNQNQGMEAIEFWVSCSLK